MRKSHTIVLLHPLTRAVETYTNWEKLALATGWSANTLRVLWSRNKKDNEKWGMIYKDYLINRKTDNIEKSSIATGKVNPAQSLIDNVINKV